MEVDKTSQSTANVLALLPGSEKPDEAVIYTAHHDHLGMDMNSKDRIYNGAKDNAAGELSTGIAKAFKMASSPPKEPFSSRSLALKNRTARVSLLRSLPHIRAWKNRCQRQH